MTSGNKVAAAAEVEGSGLHQGSSGDAHVVGLSDPAECEDTEPISKAGTRH